MPYGRAEAEALDAAADALSIGRFRGWDESSKLVV